MANSMILVTQDHYLFQGVKNFFPDIIQLDSSGKAILDNEVDELSLLVDSRSPLCHYDYLVMEAAQSRKRICCIVLDMRHREEHLLMPEIVFKHVIITRRYGDLIWAFPGDEE